MLDDDCYQPSFMDDTLKVIRSIVRSYGEDGVIFLLNHLSDIPECGKEYGLCNCLRYLIEDDRVFPCLKKAVTTVDFSRKNYFAAIRRLNIILDVTVQPCKIDCTICT